MKIDKATEILTTHQASLSMDYTPDLRDAIKLGIAALKRVESLRSNGLADRYSILPGETES